MAAWNLSGTVLVACNCNYGCPCNYNAPPTTGDCEGGWTWMIEKGSVDGTDVDGLGVAVFADWPGAIHEGGGVAVAYIDERADGAQRDVLTRVARGEIGGPWALFINTYELAGPHFVRFDVELAEYATRFEIGEVAKLQMEPIKNPVSGAEVHPSVHLPEGLVFTEGYYATSSVFTVDGGVTYDHSGKNTEFAPFAYSG
jgi:hypothetical protein